MGKALYRKYRSRSFDEVVGQEHITKTLQNALKSGKVSHAYLFTGPKGVGKTSVARILAHEVNGLPYSDDATHLDIIEIDAASNRGVDDARNLREKVYVTPTAGKYKVYIIDEVHMLTREAFNALLKTLEEPPAHAIFILATTEAHKLPDTIISRTQRFTFKPVETDAVVKHLAQIAKKEKIKISDGALQLLAAHGQGSFRDSISLLDQLSNSKDEISEQAVRQMLGLPPADAISKLVETLQNGQAAELLQSLEGLFDQGMNAVAIAHELGEQLRAQLIDGHSKAYTAQLLRELLNVAGSNSPRDYLEIALLEAVAKDRDMSHESRVKSSRSKTSQLSVPSPDVVTSGADKKPTNKASAEPREEVSTFQQFDLSLWPEVVAFAKNHNTSLYTALKLAKPEFIDGVLVLNFEFPLHQKKLDKTAQKDLIAQIVEEQCGAKIKIACVVNKDAFKSKPKTEISKIVLPVQPEPAAPFKTISSIFGEAEVLS